jgi:cephalosporin-C deacetylase-like acetyl esterase
MQGSDRMMNRMKDLVFCLVLALFLITPVALAADIAPAWVQAQLDLRHELHDWVQGSLSERSKTGPQGTDSPAIDADHWNPCLGDYWLSGDNDVPGVLLRELQALAESSEFHHGYYAETDGQKLPISFVSLLVSLSHMTPQSPAVRSLLTDAAEHLGNWASEADVPGSIPPWYDWHTHHLRSPCLGTRQVLAAPPSGVDIPLNLRFLRLGLAAYVMTEEALYLDWCRDYADEWVRDMRANNWVAPSEITVPTHEVGGFGGKWYRMKLRPDLSWEEAGFSHAGMIFSLLDLAAVAGEPRYATALLHHVEVMWNASEGTAPFTFFGSKGWSRTGSRGGRAGVAHNDGLLALEVLRLRRLAGIRSFDDRIRRWAESVGGQESQDALIYLLAYEVTREDDWLVRALRLALKALRDAKGSDAEFETAEIAAQVLVASALGGGGVGEGRFPWAEMLFADVEGGAGVSPDVAVVTYRDGNKVRCRFYNVGSATQAVTLLPPFQDQKFGRVQTYRAKVLGWPGKGVTVRVIPGYNTWVLAEFPQTSDPAGWDPPAPALVQPATPSLRVLTAPGEVEEARKGIRDWFLGRARDLDRTRWLEWQDLATERDRKKYRDSIRSRFLQALGGLPSRTPLNPEQVGTIEKPGYRIEKWLIQSRPGFYVPLNLYLPENTDGKAPGVLVFCGHEPEGKAATEYQAVCVDLVRQGYVVLIHDPVGQGERGRDSDPSTGNEHFHAGNQCYLLGWNLAQFFVWDAMRAIDFLVSRPEVDPDRIGCTGSSGGGTLTQYVAALDARVRVAVPVCYACDTSAHMEESGPDRTGEHPENILVGDLAQGIDQLGRSLLISPRPLLLNAAARDYIPIEGTRLLHLRLSTAYHVADASEALGLFEDAGGHRYSRAQREATVRFFNRWLLNKEAEFASTVEEKDFATAEALACAPGGEVSNLKGETVHSILVSEADRIRPEAAQVDTDEQIQGHQARIRDLVCSLLEIPRSRGLGSAEDRGALRLEDAVVRKVLLRGSEGIPVPAILLLREDAPAGAAAVIVLGDRAKPGTDTEDARVMLQLVNDGFFVLAIDPRGMGETRLNESEDYYSWRKGTESSLTYRSFQIGDPLFGQRVRDVLTALDFVCGATGECRQTAAIYGQGYGGLLALTAAALDQRVAAVAAAAPLFSYRTLLDAPEYVVNVSAFIPGVLAAYDLPDVVMAVAPRPVLVMNAVDGQGRSVPEARFLDTYGKCKQTFAISGGSFEYRAVGWEKAAGEVGAWFRSKLNPQ